MTSMKNGCLLVAAILVIAVRAEGAQIPVFLVVGQSNAVGTGTDAAELAASWQATQPNVLYSGPQESAVNWQSLTPPTQYSQISTPGFGPEISIGKTISDAWGGQRVGLIKFAISGSDLYSDWDANTPGSHYHSMVARIDDALAQLPVQHPGTTGKLAGIFLVHGDPEPSERAEPEDFEVDLDRVISQLRATTNNPYSAYLPTIMDRVSEISGKVSYYEQIRQAQENVAAADPFVVLVDTTSLPTGGNGIHYTSQGTVDLGVALGNAYLQVVPEPSSLLLAALGLVGLCGWGLRRRQKA